MGSKIVFVIGVILVAEGVAYTLFPNALRNMVLSLTTEQLRVAGLAALLVGFVFLWFVRDIFGG